MIATTPFYKTVMAIIALSVACSANAKRVQIGYPTPDTVEEVTFSVTAIKSEEGQKIKFIGDCEYCPEALYLTDNTAIETADGTFLSTSDMRTIGLYDAVFISFDSDQTIHSILLK